MSIKTWMDFYRAGGVSIERAMELEIDELRAALQERNAEIERITEAFGIELDTLSNRNYTLRMENAAQRKPLGDGSKEFKLYLADCDENAITPDVAGAFHAAWQAAHNVKEQP